MNAYVFEVNGNAEQPEVLAKKFNGDSNGPGKFESELFFIFVFILISL